MRLIKRILLNSLKSKTIFRFDYLVGTIFSFAYIVLKIYIWKGLYATDVPNVYSVVLQDMIVYSIVSSFTEGITGSRVMNEINDSVLNGTVVGDLLLPMNYIKYLFINSLSKGVFNTVYSVLPSVLVAMLLFGMRTPFMLANVVTYIGSVVLGIGINFFYNFSFGLTCVWFRNAFFLDNLNSVFTKLFSGSFVPIWFFPGWLGTLSLFMPFRYVIFEPVTILLGMKTAGEIGKVLAMQMGWMGILVSLSFLLWRMAQKRLMIHGG